MRSSIGRITVCAAVVFIVALLLGPTAWADARVEMVLATEDRLSATAAQQWHRLLVDLKVDSLQIRSVRADEKPEIVAAGDATNPTYRVLGILSSRDELVLPGGKYSSSDRAGISRWLATLRTEGPDRAKGGKRQLFGLTPAHLKAMQTDLARPLASGTKDRTLVEVLESAGRQLASPLVAEGAAATRVQSNTAIAEELRGYSCGTALAYLLADKRLALAARLDGRKQVEYVVVPSTSTETWPIGNTPAKRPGELLPAMFEFHHVEIDGVPLATAMDAIADKLKTPILLDRAALAKLQIDPAKVNVKLPAQRTTYGLALDRVLGQARLKEELRVDDAGKPFLWITTMKDVRGQR